MTSMYRLAFNSAPRLISNAKIITPNNNVLLKKSITTMKSAAAVTLGFHSNGAQYGGSPGPQGATSFFATSAATPMLLMSECKSLQQKCNFSSLNMSLQSQCVKLVDQKAMTPLQNRRYVSSKQLGRNMTLYTKGTFKNEGDKDTVELKTPNGNPLVLMMAWLMAKQKHVQKYVDIYTELGFDVMVVHITPWQFLWPPKGTQMVAKQTLEFLENHKSYSPIVLHGFSVAAYQFGEMMVQMAEDMNRYSNIINRIICQIWDSAADVTEIPEGLPKALFPRNKGMQRALRNYTLYHLKTFHNQATVHYYRSSQIFHNTICKKPALFFVSENDPIGPPSSNESVRSDWEKAGIKCTFKCWKQSHHAAHFLKHREEYLQLLFKHLEDCGVFKIIGFNRLSKL